MRTFLQQLPKGIRVAFELRHISWFDEEVFDCLSDHQLALCINDEEESPWSELVRTADWGYLRLRREAYTDKALANWIERLNDQKLKDAYVFFKHEETGTGPKLAKRSLKLVNS